MVSCADVKFGLLIYKYFQVKIENSQFCSYLGFKEFACMTRKQFEGSPFFAHEKKTIMVVIDCEGEG